MNRNPHSPESKVAISEGRRIGVTVRRYLDWLTVTTPKRGRKTTVEDLDARLATIDAQLGTTDTLTRLKLTQQRIEVEAQRSELEQALNETALEEEFVGVASAYAVKNGISYEAWVTVGVSPDILARAGITRGGNRNGAAAPEAAAE